MDFTEFGEIAILHTFDVFVRSAMVFSCAIGGQWSSIVISSLWTWYMGYGVPNAIKIDNGNLFMPDEMRQRLAAMEIFEME